MTQSRMTYSTTLKLNQRFETLSFETLETHHKFQTYDEFLSVFSIERKNNFDIGPNNLVQNRSQKNNRTAFIFMTNSGAFNREPRISYFTGFSGKIESSIKINKLKN